MNTLIQKVNRNELIFSSISLSAYLTGGRTNGKNTRKCKKKNVLVANENHSDVFGGNNKKNRTHLYVFSTSLPVKNIRFLATINNREHILLFILKTTLGFRLSVF